MKKVMDKNVYENVNTFSKNTVPSFQQIKTDLQTLNTQIKITIPSINTIFKKDSHTIHRV